MTGGPAEVLLLLLAAHALADFPLQGPFLAAQKDPGLPEGERQMPWWLAMAAHCAVHAGAVALLTGSALLGAAEFALHFLTDHGKCRLSRGAPAARRRRLFVLDQAAHAGAKLLLWSLWALWGARPAGEAWAGLALLAPIAALLMPAALIWADDAMRRAEGRRWESD